MRNIKNLFLNTLFVSATGSLMACSGTDKPADKTPAVVAETGLSSCQKENPARPGEVLAIVQKLLNATAGQGDPSKITLVSMPNHRSAFWDTPKLGFERAKQELGNLGEWVFPPDKAMPLADIIASQQMHMTEFTAMPAQGIALSAKSAADMVAPINAAVAAGIPVVTFDADSVASNRFFYVGPLNQPAGVVAGDEMLKALGASPSGSVVILSGAITETNLADRALGAKTQLEAKGLTVEIVNGNTDVNLTMNMDAAFAAHKDLKGFITLNGTWAPIAGAYLKTKSMAGTIKLIGWDLKVETQPLLRDGTIQAALAQRAYFHGYLPVYLNYAIATLGKEKVATLLGTSLSGPKGDLLNTGMDVVTSTNIDSYLSYQTDCLSVASN